MKTLGRIIGIICIAVLCVAAVVLGSDPSTMAVVTPAVTAPEPTVSFLLWAQQNLAAILGVGLALSEIMGSSPWFKGNGIIHSITTSLKFLLQKQAP